MRRLRSDADPPEHPVIRAIHAVTSAMSLLAGVGIVLLMLIALADIGSRKFVGPGIAGAYEVTEIALAAVVFAGMASAEAHNTHVRTPLLVDALPRRAGDVARLIGLAAVVIGMAILTYLTARAGINSYRTGEYRFGLNQVPVWPARMFIPLGLASLLLEFLIDMVPILSRIHHNGPYPNRFGPETIEVSEVTL